MGDLFRQELRETDVAARYGGDEFAVILGKTDKAGAMQIVERLRQAASIKSDQMGILGLRITFSLGISLFPEHGKTYEQMIFTADQAELKAKKQGKDQVCMAGAES
jgi:diguanylate cyclase (GGDEF)-like protein